MVPESPPKSLWAVLFEPKTSCTFFISLHKRRVIILMWVMLCPWVNWYTRKTCHVYFCTLLSYCPICRRGLVSLVCDSGFLLSPPSPSLSAAWSHWFYVSSTQREPPYIQNFMTVFHTRCPPSGLPMSWVLFPSYVFNYTTSLFLAVFFPSKPHLDSCHPAFSTLV